MWPLANLALDEFAAHGKCEFLRQFSEPFTIMVIADLLGVPEDDRDSFKAMLASVPATGTLGEEYDNPMVFLEESFIRYVEDRLRQPRDDVLTKLALAPFDDGSMPEVIEIVREATFLFVVGQGTTALLLASGTAIPRRASGGPAAAPGATRPHPELRRGDAPVGEPGEGSLPDGAARHVGGRGGCPGGHHGDARHRRGEPLQLPVANPTSSCLDGATHWSTSPSRWGRMRASASHSHGRIAVSPWSRSSTAWGRHPHLRARARSRGDRHYQYDPTYLFRGLDVAPPGVHTARGIQLTWACSTARS